jgi:hypothetical protein
VKGESNLSSSVEPRREIEETIQRRSNFVLVSRHFTWWVLQMYQWTKLPITPNVIMSFAFPSYCYNMVGVVELMHMVRSHGKNPITQRSVPSTAHFPYWATCDRSKLSKQLNIGCFYDIITIMHFLGCIGYLSYKSNSLLLHLGVTCINSQCIYVRINNLARELANHHAYAYACSIVFPMH